MNDTEVKKLCKKEIIDRANELLKDNLISHPPILAQELAQQCGLTVISVDFNKLNEKYHNISGFIQASTNRMYINSNETAERQNFTIAHELGHHILGHTKNPGYRVLYRNQSLTNNEPMEQEANCFAANLLVPEKFLKDLLNEFPYINNSDIAVIFGVSEVVVRFRKQQLGIA